MLMKALRRFVPFSDVNAFGVSFPSVHEARWLTDQSRYSPDLGYLEQSEFQLLFSCDDTRVGYERYSLVSDSVTLGTAYTQETFSYWLQEFQTKDGVERIPIPMRQQNAPSIRYFPPALKVKGELIAVRPYQFQGLDDYKRNREQFRRQRVNVLVPYRTRVDEHGAALHGIEVPEALRGKGHIFDLPEKVHVIRAWMYVGIPGYWDNLFDAGFRGFKTVNYYESRRAWLKEYYDFPKHPLT